MTSLLITFNSFSINNYTTLEYGDTIQFSIGEDTLSWTPTNPEVDDLNSGTTVLLATGIPTVHLTTPPAPSNFKIKKSGDAQFLPGSSVVTNVVDWVQYVPSSPNWSISLNPIFKNLSI